MNLRRFLDVTTSTAASAARPNFGNYMVERRKVPALPIELYEFEACPFCRRAREAFSALSIDVTVYPCPKGGPNYRRKVIAEGGKSLFPYLVDPNTSTSMYESADIVRYLFEEYGSGKVPWYLRSETFFVATSAVASGMRPQRGRRYRQARQPEQILELFGYEGSPFCRIAREAFSELELPYVQRNLPRGSPERAAFIARSGKMQVPYLVDPNTSTQMFESADIVAYLNQTYAL